MNIRCLMEKDAERMLAWMHSPDINYWFRFDGNSKTKQDVTEFICETKNKIDELHYAIVDDTDQYLGTVSLKNIDEVNLCAEYAIVVCPDQTGKGTAKFATDAILKIAFDQINLQRVYLNVLSKNIRACRFYEKYGFFYEGEARKALLHRGELNNLKWYSILKEEM